MDASFAVAVVVCLIKALLHYWGRFRVKPCLGVALCRSGIDVLGKGMASLLARVRTLQCFWYVAFISTTKNLISLAYGVVRDRMVNWRLGIV